jgi:hypothetical protein
MPLPKSIWLTADHLVRPKAILRVAHTTPRIKAAAAVLSNIVVALLCMAVIA